MWHVHQSNPILILVLLLLSHLVVVTSFGHEKLNFSPLFQPTRRTNSAQKFVCSKQEMIIPSFSNYPRREKSLLASNTNQDCSDILSALQTLDGELNDAILREEYEVASRIKRQIEEMRRDVTLGMDIFDAFISVYH
jgi:hypothetical protein